MAPARPTAGEGRAVIGSLIADGGRDGSHARGQGHAPVDAAVFPTPILPVFPTPDAAVSPHESVQPGPEQRLRPFLTQGSASLG